jgi:hypothetical protein
VEQTKDQVGKVSGMKEKCLHSIDFKGKRPLGRMRHRRDEFTKKHGF